MLSLLCVGECHSSLWKSDPVGCKSLKEKLITITMIFMIIETMIIIIIIIVIIIIMIFLCLIRKCFTFFQFSMFFNWFSGNPCSLCESFCNKQSKPFFVIFDSMQTLLNFTSFGQIPVLKNLGSSSSLSTWLLDHWNSSWRRHERA